MKKARIVITLITTLWLCWQNMSAQPFYRVIYYDEEDGVPSSHVTQLLQDGRGFLWFSTWNGLCRYDGYEFHTFKPTADEERGIFSDRIRNISLRTDGTMICRINDDDYVLFNPRSCHFTALTGTDAEEAAAEAKRYRESKTLVVDSLLTWRDNDGTEWQLQPSGLLLNKNLTGTFTVCEHLPPPRNIHFASLDRQGNLWVPALNGIYKICTGIRHTHELPMEQKSEAKCLFSDRHHRYWICTKDGAIRVMDGETDRLLGFLGPDGLFHNQYVCFPSPVYCMAEDEDCTLWLGTKPDGIYRLKPQGLSRYSVEHLTRLPDLNIYAFASDSQGRLWVATLGGGLCYTAEPRSAQPVFTVPVGYPHDKAQRVRHTIVTRQGMLACATTDGLVVARLEDDAEKMQFCLYQHEPGNTASISSNATMAVIEDGRGHILVSTENNGINQADERSLTEGPVIFRHMIPDDEPSHCVIQALSMTDNGGWMAVNGRQLTFFDSTGHGRMVDARHLQANYRFSETSPLRLSGNRWLLGTDNGAFIMDSAVVRQPSYTPRLVLTSLSVQGGRNQWNVEYADTLRLLPDERSVIVRFAALDFTNPEHISYAFRLSGGNDRSEWNDLGRNRSVTLLDLEPGTYTLEVRSTDSSGQWQDNARQFRIIVEPTFFESWYGRLLLLLVFLGVVSTAVYTIYYIRRISRQHHEMQEKYLSLLDERAALPSDEREASPMVVASGTTEMRLSDDDEAFMTRVMTYIEQHIGDSDANIDDMAVTAAVSRSGLIRKLKSIVGQTPANFLREARIKRAGQLLATTTESVSDIAYKCGFTDPKYFSKCFRSSTGLSPSDYRTNHI